MFEFDRRQLLVYLAVGVAILAIGLVSLKQSGESGDAATAAGGDPGAAAGRPGSGQPGGFAITTRSRHLVVDVSGAVARPGVYRLPEGTRVIDAIRRAGGAAPGGAVEAINRAALLADGQQIVIPARSPTAVAPGGDSGGGGTAAGPAPGGGPVSLSSATAGQLEEIDGIGPVTARKIIEFRDSKGGLGSVEDLDEVSGIGPVTMESLRSALQP